MEFTHIANPVRVNAHQIISYSSGPNEPISLRLDDGTTFIPPQEMMARYVPSSGDYLVTQEDGYKYLNPKDVFERKYHKVESQQVIEDQRPYLLGTFGYAISYIKQGKRVARSGWNGKGMWIALSGSTTEPRNIAWENFWSKNASEFARVENGGGAEVLPCILMKTADNRILMGWLASQSDMLAEDWQVV